MISCHQDLLGGNEIGVLNIRCLLFGAHRIPAPLMAASIVDNIIAAAATAATVAIAATADVVSISPIAARVPAVVVSIAVPGRRPPTHRNGLHGDAAADGHVAAVFATLTVLVSKSCRGESWCRRGWGSLAHPRIKQPARGDGIEQKCHGLRIEQKARLDVSAHMTHASVRSHRHAPLSQFRCTQRFAWVQVSDTVLIHARSHLEAIKHRRAQQLSVMLACACVVHWVALACPESWRHMVCGCGCEGPGGGGECPREGNSGGGDGPLIGEGGRSEAGEW